MSLFAPAKKTPEALMNEAVASIESTLSKIDEAQAEINAQKAEHERAAAELKAKMAQCDEHGSRLTRIKTRFQDLLA